MGVSRSYLYRAFRPSSPAPPRDYWPAAASGGLSAPAPQHPQRGRRGQHVGFEDHFYIFPDLPPDHRSLPHGLPDQRS